MGSAPIRLIPDRASIEEAEKTSGQGLILLNQPDPRIFAVILRSLCHGSLAGGLLRHVPVSRNPELINNVLQFARKPGQL